MSNSTVALRTPLMQNSEDALRAVEAIIRANSKTFHLATGLLPRSERLAIRALYAFCRATDDLVDCAETTLRDVEDWREQVGRPSDEQTHPVLRAWALVREQYAIDRRYEQELINGVSNDIQFRAYRTWQELEYYCYQVASTVGLLSMPVIGLARGANFEAAAPYAIHLGVALQLTNILRDVGEDAARGRVYFPEEDLQRFGLTSADIANQVYDDRFIQLMKFEIQRARRLYELALPGIRLLSAHARPAVGAAALLYRAILDEIEAIDYQVHRLRAHTSGPRKLAMLPGILWNIATLPAPRVRQA